MAADFPDSPQGWADRSDHFLEVAQKPGNAGLFGLSGIQTDLWDSRNDDLKALLAQREVLEDQLAGVNAQIKVTGDVLEDTARADLGIAAASPASAQLKAEAGVTIARETTHPAPIVPTNLVATSDSNGLVKLKWDRAGNIRNAKFVVEKLMADAWTMQDIVTATSATLTSKVGEQAKYRVRARNGEGTSEPSNVAVIYAS